MEHATSARRRATKPTSARMEASALATMPLAGAMARENSRERATIAERKGTRKLIAGSWKKTSIAVQVQLQAPAGSTDLHP